MAGPPAPLSQMTEDELVIRARAAMNRATAAGRGTLGWSVQWAAYDTVMTELHRRAAAWVATASPDALSAARALLLGPWERR